MKLTFLNNAMFDDLIGKVVDFTEIISPTVFFNIDLNIIENVDVVYIDQAARVPFSNSFVVVLMNDDHTQRTTNILR